MYAGYTGSWHDLCARAGSLKHYVARGVSDPAMFKRTSNDIANTQFSLILILDSATSVLATTSASKLFADNFYPQHQTNPQQTMAPPSKPVKKAPAASRPTKSLGGIKSKTHTANGVAKPAHKNDKRTPKQRAADLARLEKALPVLNTVVPAEALGKKKGGHGKIGKVFVDDHDKDKMMRFVEQAAGKQEHGEESKLERARKLEAIREARRKEREKKEQVRKEKFDDAKDRVRRKRKPKGGDAQDSPEPEPKKSKKRVGFA